MTTEVKAAEPKAEPKATYETREGAHCAVHDNTEVVRVIKVAPVEVPDAPPPESGMTAAQKRAATLAARRR